MASIEKSKNPKRCNLFTYLKCKQLHSTRFYCITNHVNFKFPCIYCIICSFSLFPLSLSLSFFFVPCSSVRAKYVLILKFMNVSKMKNKHIHARTRASIALKFVIFKFTQCFSFLLSSSSFSSSSQFYM